MEHEAKINETRAWLEKAVQDLQSAKWLLSSPDALYNAVGFHCQQAAEKTLKAFLAWQDEPFEKTHSLVALVGKCLSFDQDFQGLRQAAVTLTHMQWRSGTLVICLSLRWRRLSVLTYWLKKYGNS